MVIVFDLDDTLYEELSYVRSGFKAVADYLSPLLSMDKEKIAASLYEEVLVQRDNVFDRFLQKLRIQNKQLVKNCLRVYRNHQPKLNLFLEAHACLARFQHHPLYIVTDGNHLVQRKKVTALGLDLFVKQCFFTYAHGLRHRKPSPYCFEKICHLERIDPSSLVYVADNPYKDFVGIKPLGFQTIRVLTGPYAQVQVEERFDAEMTLSNLNGLDELLVTSLFQKGKCL